MGGGHEWTGVRWVSDVKCVVSCWNSCKGIKSILEENKRKKIGEGKEDTSTQVEVNVGLARFNLLSPDLSSGYQVVPAVEQLHGKRRDHRVVGEREDDGSGCSLGAECDRLLQALDGCPSLEERLDRSGDEVGIGVHSKSAGEGGSWNAGRACDLFLDAISRGDINLEGIGVADSCNGRAAAVADTELVWVGLEAVQVDSAAVG